jgi:hypothetical protein
MVGVGEAWLCLGLTILSTKKEEQKKGRGPERGVGAGGI